MKRSAFLLVLLALLAVPAWAEPTGGTAGCGLYEYAARITEVHDGDTVTADIDLGFDIVHANQKLRLYGIDAPEVRGDQRAAGLRARDALRERVLGRDVTICSIRDGKGKYGRYLARIFHEGALINAWLVLNDYAEPRFYD